MPEGYAPKLRRPATLDHLRKKEPLEQTVPIILNDHVVRDLEEARERLVAALTDTEKKAAQEAVTIAKKAVEEATVEMRFRSIGRKGYDALVTEHPPTDAQQAEFKAEHADQGELAYNPETFPPALVAACCIEPKMTLEEVQEFWDTWNGNEVQPLFVAAISVCNNRRIAYLGKGFGETDG